MSSQQTHQVTWHEVTEELMSVYNRQEYQQALDLAQRALEVARDTFGDDHPNYAVSLNNLAGVHFCLGDYQSAEPLYVKALGLFDRHLGREHPATAKYVKNLIMLYNTVGKRDDAQALRETYFERN